MTIDDCSNIFDTLDRELWLITARSGEQSSGLIATFVSNASLVPSLPRMMAGLAKHHFTHELIEASGSLCMHLIDESHLDWVWHFGIPSGRDVSKLTGLDARYGATGSPILSGAVAWLDCQVESQLDTGDRTIFLAKVVEARKESERLPLTLKRALQLAPPERLKQLKERMETDIQTDRAAILNWRTQQKDQ